MTIDLDEIEAAASAIEQAAAFDDAAAAQHRLEVALPTEAVLELVARVRSLEDGLRYVIDSLESMWLTEYDTGRNAPPPEIAKYRRLLGG